jgi:hypothetical protein
MGAAAEFAPPLAGDSAERLLGAARARLESSFDAQWRERVAESWKQVHDNTRNQRLRLSELRSRAAQTGLDEQKALELADLEEDVGEGPVASLRMHRALVAKYPESRPARFSLARQLLRASDADGVAPMEAIIESEPSAFTAGAELLRDYYWRRNERELALHWQRRFAERAGEVHAAQRKLHR